MSRHLDRERIEGFESLSDDARAAALAHLAGCAACRAAWIAGEPSRVFALLAAAEIPADRLEALSRRIEIEIAPRPARPSKWFGAASIAASLLLAALLGGLLWSHELPAEPIARIGEIGLQPRTPADDEARLVALPGEGTRVLDLNIGETQVLLIFDESIEL